MFSQNSWFLLSFFFKVKYFIKYYYVFQKKIMDDDKVLNLLNSKNDNN